ncbi:MAG: acyl carrier protein [Oscillospiraceae bacterium]|nr:acyl carrier protein [Oscillospiraceae bacterium]
MFEEIKELLVSQMGLDAGSIKPEARLIADLKLNSLELAEFILICEEEYGITIEDEDLKKLITVKDIAVYAEKRKYEI